MGGMLINFSQVHHEKSKHQLLSGMSSVRGDLELKVLQVLPARERREGKAPDHPGALRANVETIGGLGIERRSGQDRHEVQ